MRDLHFYYYGYAITKHNRHLGLVRRRVGRGGRILFEKFNHSLMDLVKETNDSDQETNSDEMPFKFNVLNKFKTFYPKDCFDVVNVNTSTSHGNVNDQEAQESLSRTKKLKLKPLTLKNNRPNNEFCFVSNNIEMSSGSSSEDERETSRILSSESNLNDSSELINVDSFINVTSGNEETDKLVYDHRLFPVYQLTQLEKSKASENQRFLG